MKSKNKFSCFKYWFTDRWLYRYILSAILHPKKFIFLTKYPFWKSYNVWTRRFSGFDHSMYEWIPDGWRKVLGPGLTVDIVEALEKDNIPKRKWTDALQWTDIKQKYGTLRLNASTTERIQQVLYKYECASMGYCENCGKPARYITHGWISYLCEDCFKECVEKYGDGGERLTAEDLPTYYTYKDGVETSYTPLERWGIDLEKMWGLK